MLLELTVEDFAIIRHSQLEFSPGLNVLTGETGAGKSLLIDAMTVLLGGRASEEFIRTGADRAVITAVFDISKALAVKRLLTEHGFDGEELIISREIRRGGRNMNRINGRPVSVATLRSITEALVEIHGQHQHQDLLRPEMHRALLDAWAAPEIDPIQQQISALYQERQRLIHELKELSGDARQRAHTLDLYRFQIQEIDSAQLDPDEEEKLRELRTRTANAERIREAISAGYEAIYGGGQAPSALDQAGVALTSLQRIANLDPQLQSPIQLLESAMANLDEAARILRSRLEETEFDPHVVAQLEDRWRLIGDLKRKYGDSIEQILAYRQQIADEVERLENAEELAATIESQLYTVTEELEGLCEQLTCLREEAGVSFAQAIVKELQELALNGSVEVVVSQKENPQGINHRGRKVNVGPAGCDQVEILFSANPGEPPRPLQRVASGGELSRIMLAIINILGQQGDSTPTVIFDEIDAGIGGRTATTVADKLAATATHRQVLCVTHLPQIASRADRHFCIEKKSDAGGTVTEVLVLSEEGRELEIARMLAGGQAEVDLAHARVLLQRARSARTG